MSIRTRNILKGWFSTGKYPTETQFSDFFDSYVHQSEDTIEINAVNGLQEALDSKAANEDVVNPPQTLADGSSGSILMGYTTVDEAIIVSVAVKRNSLAFTQDLKLVYDGTVLHLSEGEVVPYISATPTLGFTWGKLINGNEIRLTYELSSGMGDATLKYKSQKI